MSNDLSNNNSISSNKIKVFFATPCFGAQVSCNYTHSLIQTIKLLSNHNIDSVYAFLPNQIVTRARNLLTHMFLKTDATHLFFIDADIQFRPEDVLEMIHNNKSICVGLYANKDYIVNSNHDTNDANDANDANSDFFFKCIQYSSTFEQNINSLVNNKLIKIKHGATGFMIIERDVLIHLKNIVKSYIHNDETVHAFFNCEVHNNTYLTEDYYFCQLWKNYCHDYNLQNPNSMLDDSIWADLSICLNHEGWHSYKGNPFKTFSLVSNEK